MAFVIGLASAGIGAGILAGIFMFGVYAIVLAVQEHFANQPQQQNFKDKKTVEKIKKEMFGDDSPTVFIKGNEPREPSDLYSYPDDSCFIMYDGLLPAPTTEFQTIGSTEYIFNNKKELSDFIKKKSLDFYGGIDDEDWLSAVIIYQFDSAKKMYKNQFYKDKSTWSDCFFLEYSD